MEATYDKNNTDSTFDNDTAHFKFSNMDGGLDMSSDMLETNELEEQQMISSPTITKNNYNESNHVHISDKSTDVVDHHQRFVDDFGPETDVDAMDDPNTIKFPVEHQTNDSINEYNVFNGVKPFSLENKIIQQLSEQNRDFLSDSNPFKNDHFDQFSDDQLVLDDTIDKKSEVVDNKIIDALESLAVSNGDQEKFELESKKQMENILDASQKTPEIPDFTEKVDVIHEKNSFTLDSAAETDETFVQHSENPFNRPVNDGAARFEKADTGLLTDTTCVEESVGEDTEEEEDEWNYIKADKKSEENLQRSEILDHHISDEAEFVEQHQSKENEQSESVTVLAELPVLNIVYDSQFPDLPLADSVEKKDTFEKEKVEDEKIIEASAPVSEISKNIYPEESYSVEDTSTIVIQQEFADSEIGPPIVSLSTVTVESLEDIDHTPLSEERSVGTERKLLEEKISEFSSEDKNIASIEPVADDASSLEVLQEDTLSTDIEVEQEPQNVEPTIDPLDNEEPITTLIDEELQFTLEPKESADVELVRPDSLSLEMASKLNPEAKEFVPVSSPTRSNPTSPVANAPSMVPNSYLMLDDDTVVAQSPKKCSTTMDNIDVPEEDAFQHEMNKRPHELEKPSEYVNGSAEISARSHSPASEPSYQELNLKEAMQADEKLEHDYNDEKQIVPEEGPSELSNEQNILHVLNKEQDPMNMSFYEGRDEALLGNSDELNKVHVLPEEDDDDEQPKDESDKIQMDDDETTPVESTHDGEPSDDKGNVVEPETASHTTMEDELHEVSKLTVHDEPSATIYAVASQVVNDVAALVDQMQIESPISNEIHDSEIKPEEKVELETEDVAMEQSNDILISLEIQNEPKPMEEAIVVEEHTESPHGGVVDDENNRHTAETEELVSPLVEVVAENEFITDESVLNVLSHSQLVFSAEAPVDYEALVEEPAKELTIPTIVESVPITKDNSESTIETAVTDLINTVTLASEQEVKPAKEPKPAEIAPKSAAHKVTASKTAATAKQTAAKTISKPSALTTDKKAPVSAKVPSKSVPAKSSIAPKLSTATNTAKKTSTISHALSATSSRAVGTAKPSTAPSTTRTSLTGSLTNKSMVTEKKAPLVAKKAVTSAVNGDVKTTTTRKPLTSSILKTTTTTKSSSSPGNNSSVPNARLSGSVKSTSAKPLTATTKTSTTAPAKPSLATTRTSATAPTTKPRTAPSTASKTASATSTSTVTSKTSQGSSSTVTKRVSTVGHAATTRTTTASKTATTATKTSSVTSRASTVSKLSSSSATSTVRKTAAASPVKKAVSSPASKTAAKTTTSTGKTITSTKTVVSNHVNDVKAPLTEDSISSDLLNLDKQLKNDNNQLITKNGIDSQMMVIDSAAD